MWNPMPWWLFLCGVMSVKLFLSWLLCIDLINLFFVCCVSVVVVYVFEIVDRVLSPANPFPFVFPVAEQDLSCAFVISPANPPVLCVPYVCALAVVLRTVPVAFPSAPPFVSVPLIRVFVTVQDLIVFCLV